jgi:adenine deaminase
MKYDFPNRRLVETALGNEPADLVVLDGTLLDVYSGRMLPHRSVAVRDRWIAYVGLDASHTIGEKTTVIEASNRLICPGYMDTHTHLAYYFDMFDFLRYAIPCGITTLITEVETYFFASGAQGFRAFLDVVRDSPIKLFSLICPMISISPVASNLAVTEDQAKELLQDESVLGLGESYWQGTILTPDDRVINLIKETRCMGKSVQGHAAGATDRKLAAYAAAGPLSCHEAISPENVLSRLELGFYVMVREGDIRSDLGVLGPIKDDVDFRRVILVTDGSNPEMVVKHGYLVDVIQKTVDMGIDPLRAVQMVSLNPAEHFGLDYLLGGIAPGRFADILLLPEPGWMKPDLVISEGRIVAENGKMTIPVKRTKPYPDFLLKTVRMDYFSPSRLIVPSSTVKPYGSVRTMDIQPGGLVTREGSARARIESGEIVADPENDLLKIVFIERVSGNAEKFIGFVRGYGLKSGAVATTLCWDSSGVVAIGANDEDLAMAINRVIETQGGTSLALAGKILQDMPCDVGGFVSQMSIEDLASKLINFQRLMTNLGTELHFAHLTLCVLTSAAIPFIKITEKGYYRFKENDYVGI